MAMIETGLARLRKSGPILGLTLATRSVTAGNRRLVAVLIVFAALALAAYRDAVLAGPLAPLAARTADATFLVLRALDVDAARKGATVIYDPAGGFAYEVYYKCTGFLPAAFLAVAILASRGRRWHKSIGVVVGVPLIGALNLARLAHLYVIGISRPELFDLAHGVLWEAVMVLGVAGTWFAWKKWAS